ncbi:MAG TPA: serine hydrolase [Bryobacteraceae bacterium]|nr:serine hydrolase [Bryobacteraceae bacterium]
MISSKVSVGLFAIVFCAALLPAQERIDAASPYQETAAALERMVTREMANQSLPAVSIVLVDQQRVVWAQGFGFADPQKKVAAAADTVYRVGSVSKLFTDTALMQLVEKHELDLDAPVSRYLPAFHPVNPFGEPITLRELMSHRSGLVREPPAGHYFDSTSPSLQATVESLNDTKLVYRPGTRTKYSNAAVAVAGYVLEKRSGQPFASYLQKAVLEPLGMSHSSFAPAPQIAGKLARAFVWTYDGRVFDAPSFELGMAPAGCMYSSVLDLAKFLGMLFDDGGRILKPETLQAMWQPQFSQGGRPGPFGIGFRLSSLDGHSLVGHGGAIYGFATELEALPDDKLGVAVVTTMDSANASVTKIANQALRLMLAAKAGKPLPAIPETEPVSLELARAAEARYASGPKGIELLEENGKLLALRAEGGEKVPLRLSGHELIVDGRLSFGERFELFPGSLKAGDAIFRRVETARPKPAPHAWEGLIGEYGWDYDTLYILEKDGKLTSLIEWYDYEPLVEISPDVYRYPARGLYDGETLTFRRDARGRATEVKVGAVVFKRRAVGPADGKIFRIKPLKPVDELRNEALAAQPPQESGNFKPADLVELTTIDPSIKLDIRYATTNDFLSTPVYRQARAFMERPAAEAVARASRELHKQGFGLLIHDAYRPWYVTKIFWDASPEPDRIFVADPSQGSRHNRGCAVDLTLYELSTGRPVQMTGVYDEMSPRSYPYYPGGTSEQRWLRAVLRHAMEEQGFSVYETEWWHFDFHDWRSYPILNQTFEQLDARRSAAH